ncbi:MAG: LLM class flavin-dependent oxidoreductase, partial [Nitrosopumilaceae archaeon]|nr:LLM class flavin-dependent oxidoreductase [Nitrosopumilaceae archaeon]NIV65907.1 LLM class flavin-dependent oxidoreductase [Nitrosopumilaceae archaeon]NIX61528.1 LLM class flavin-dependent oxidoreductase [Nitrosopumilaceae archaeon]
MSPELLEYQELEKRAEKIEELGYHSLWISDHLQGIYNTPEDPRLESWTTL